MELVIKSDLMKLLVLSTLVLWFLLVGVLGSFLTFHFIS